MHQQGIVTFIKSILDQPIEHTAGLYRNNKVGGGILELDLLLLHIIWDAVSGVADVVPTVKLLLLALAIRLYEVKIPYDSGPILFWAELKILSETVGHDLKVLGEEVTLILGAELCLAPPFRNIIGLSQGGGFVVFNHLPDELEHIGCAQEHHGSLDLLGTPCALEIAILPNVGPRIELDIGLGTQGQDHLGDLSLV